MVEPALFEGVYYTAPVPSSLRSLAVLALVFDRVHFPGVYIPSSIDLKATDDEITRIRNAHGAKRSVAEAQLENAMIYALHRPYVEDFCLFTGQYGYMGTLEQGTRELVRDFEEAVYGPPPAGFFPTYTMGFAKSLPGPETASVNGPSWLSYPPNALLYSLRMGLPLVHDDPRLPVLGVPAVKANATALSTILALEAVQLALPPLPTLRFEQIAELRAHTRQDVQPFRLAMLKLSKDLNAAILSDSPLAEVQKEARFLVEATVLPQLAELRAAVSRPSRPWYRLAADAGRAVPELVGNFATLPLSMATAKLLARIAGALADVRDDQLAATGAVKRGGFHYLLRLQDAVAE